MSKIRTTKEDFLRCAHARHGDRYDYSHVEYLGRKVKVYIQCKKHGAFLIRPEKHLLGAGCPFCFGKSTTAQFIKDSIEKHGSIYQYHNTIYKNITTRVKITCPTHGDFDQFPKEHLKSKNACPTCSKRNFATVDFINFSNRIHNNRYDYSKVSYTNARSNVEIICSKHGTFIQQASRHMQGSGCSKCHSNTSKMEKEWLDSLNIEESNRAINIIVSGYVKPLIADAYDPVSNTVYEFYGDLWHGNPKVFKTEDNHPVKKTMTFGDLYEKTMVREARIKDSGFNLVTIWENDWLESKKTSDEED